MDGRPMDLDDLRSVLAVTAHPDDVDFGAAGTVAQLTEAGVEVAYCIVTDGQTGGWDRDVPREDVPSIRRDEQRAAAATVGVEEVRFLGRVDGQVVADQALRRDISRVIRQVRPDVVIAMTPERNWRHIGISHPDHRATGDATLDAVYPDARNPFAHPELLQHEELEPHVVKEVWLIGDPAADVARDVTDQLERKLDAIACHASQLEDPDAMRERVRGRTAELASEHGLPDGRHAESHRRVVIE